MRLQSGDVLSIEGNRACARRQLSADHIEQRRLARAIRSDQRMSRAGLHGKRHVIDRLEPAEMPRDALELKTGRAHRATWHRAVRSGSARDRISRTGRPRKRVDDGVLQLAVHALDPADVDVLDRIAVLVELHRPARQTVWLHPSQRVEQEPGDLRPVRLWR